MKIKLLIDKINDKNCSKIAQRLYEFTRFCGQGFFEDDFSHDYYDHDASLDIENYDYIFVIKAGHLFWDRLIFDQCLEEKITKLSNEPVVGDENWFLIDCKKINTKIFNKALRSERARSLLKEEYNIKPFSDSINEQIIFSFPETMYPYIEELMLDLKSNVPDKLKPFADELKMSARTLERCYYILNTEHVNITKTFENKFDNYIGVCGGLKTYILLGQEYFSENTNVLMFDISPAAIRWQQFLKETWNGEVEHLSSIAQLFKEEVYKLGLPFNPIGRRADGRMTKSERAHHLNIDLCNYLEDNNIDSQQLKHNWKRFHNMNVTYEQVDLFNTADVDKLIQHTKLGTNTYFWLSNCFQMDRLIFKYGTKWTWDSEASFKKDFRSKSYTPCTFDVDDEIT
jgi:hypothetical protein